MRITIFGSSSPNTKQSFVDAAYALGQMMAKRGHTCVNGGGRFGVMGGVNQGCRASKGAKGFILIITRISLSHPNSYQGAIIGAFMIHHLDLKTLTRISP